MTPTQPPDPDISAGAGVACAMVGCADIATATPKASAKAHARAMYLAAANHSSPVLPPKVTEFAPPPQGRDARRPKTRVVHYLFFGRCRSAVGTDVGHSLLVCDEKTARPS